MPSRYLALKEQGLLLSTCEVETELLDLNQQYPGILNYTASDLAFAESKLKNLCRMELHYRDHYRQCVTLLDRLELEVAQLEEELKENVGQEKVMFAKTLEQASFVEETRKKKKNNFQEIQRFVNDKNPGVPILMYQMPIQNFNDSVSLFLKHVDTFVTKHFGACESSGSDKVHGRIDDLKCKWSQVEEQYLSTKLDVVGRANIVEKFLNLPIEAKSETKLELQVKELRARNSTMDAEFDALLFENQNLMKKAIQSECDLMLHKRFEAKKIRALQRNKLLCFIQAVVSNVLTDAELLWIFMKVDLEKLNDHMKAIQGVVAGEFDPQSDHVRM